MADESGSYVTRRELSDALRVAKWEGRAYALGLALLVVTGAGRHGSAVAGALHFLGL